MDEEAGGRELIRSRSPHRQQGVVAIEFAIAAPIFLTFLYGLLWIGTYINLMASLPIAMENAVRAAMTRGQQEFVTRGKVAYSTNFDYSSTIASWDQSSVPSGALGAAFFSSNISSGTGRSSSYTAYRSWNHNTTLPDHYVLAQIFLNESIRESLGGTVSFPCDPNTDTAARAMKTSCLKCFFLNPEDLSDTAINLESDARYVSMALRCQLRPGNQLFSVFQAMFTAITKQPIGVSYLFPVVQHDTVWTLPFDGAYW